MKTHCKLQTIAVRSGLCSDQQTGAITPPIHLSSTYQLPGYQQKGEFDYSRTVNPTRQLLAKALADLEGGEHAIITNTGMSAILLTCQLLNPQDLLVISHDCYGGSYRLFTHLAERQLFKLLIIDQNDEKALDRALTKHPKMIWVETPSNPLLSLYDIRLICQKAHRVNSLVAVDNTFLSPILQRPLDLGADIVIHSCTKFINGHSDIVSGAVITQTATLGETLAWWANCLGITGSAFDSYMVLRGLRTLPIRMQNHEENTRAIVDFLCQHPAIKTVYYPGLASHPGHEVARQQQRGFGSLVSFELVGGEPAVTTLLEQLNLFIQAQSLGGIESLINHPATMTHSAMSPKALATAGISLALLRLSVGLESQTALIDDLSQALDKTLNRN